MEINWERIIGICFILLGILSLFTIFQSIGCGVDLKYSFNTEESCLGMEKFLDFVYFGENIYKLGLEIIIVVSLFVVGGIFIVGGRY